MTTEGPGPLVRAATTDDLEAIVDIYLALARHHAALAPAAYRVPEREAVRARFGHQLEEADEEDLHLVAAMDGRVVGWADAFRRPDGAAGSMRIPSRSAEIGIAVLHEWRGRGIGTALLAAVEAWARDERLDALLLDVAVENADAERLYARLGYEPVSRTLALRLTPRARDA